jgi:hypothetical protein
MNTFFDGIVVLLSFYDGLHVDLWAAALPGQRQQQYVL